MYLIISRPAFLKLIANLVTTSISLIHLLILYGLQVSVHPLLFCHFLCPYFFLTFIQVLDPRIGYKSLNEDYSNDEDLIDGLRNSKTALENHFNQYYANRFNPISKSATTPAQAAKTDEQPRSRNFIARYEKWQQPVQNELEAFLALPPQHFSSCNPIKWWYSHRDEFPNLYRLAKDILAIPGMFYWYCCVDLIDTILGSAVAVERIFSGGRDTISLRRASLQPNTIRMLMILKQHIRMSCT
jgi:hypothetical protein